MNGTEQKKISNFCSGEDSLRGGSTPFITDNGGYILDAHFGQTIIKPTELEERIVKINGVVEVGLFVGMCDAIVMASNEEVMTLINDSGSLIINFLSPL